MLQLVRWSLCVLLTSGCYTGPEDVDEEVFAATESSDAGPDVDGMDGPASPSMPGGEDGSPSGGSGGGGDDADDDDDDDDDDTPATPPDGDVVELVIPDGTGNGPWNTAETIVVMRVGQTLRIRNNDAQPHTLHTGGRPVEHGGAIAPGEFADSPVIEPYDPGDGPPATYDHDTQASVWLLALP